MACSSCEKRKREMAARIKATQRNANGLRTPPSRPRRKTQSVIRSVRPSARRS